MTVGGRLGNWETRQEAASGRWRHTQGVEQCLSQTETFTDTLAVGMENGAAPLGNSGAENTCSSDSAVPLLGLCPQELKAGS